MIEITVRDAAGNALASVRHENEALLCFDRAYIDGDRVLSRRADALDYSGEIGIVQDGETATIKKVEFGSGWLRLVPINPAYAPRTIKGIDLEQVRIIGIPMVLVRELEER